MKHKFAIILGPILAAAAFFTDSLAGLAILGLIAIGYPAYMVLTYRRPEHSHKR